MQLIEETYPAQIAMLSYKITASEYGIDIKISGYNEKLPVRNIIDIITVINVPSNLFLWLRGIN